MTAQAETMIDPKAFRTVLGHFTTGVTIITAASAQGPVGFACQSFAALSLDPPLVLFCPAKTSGSWPVIEQTGHFAVNVLAEHQQDVSSVFGARGEDKFARVDWTPADKSSSPLITDTLTWLDCAIDTVHDAGDHYIVIGRVLELGHTSHAKPLLFDRGRYRTTADTPGEALPTNTALDAFLTWPIGDDWL